MNTESYVEWELMWSSLMTDDMLNRRMLAMDWVPGILRHEWMLGLDSMNVKTANECVPNMCSLVCEHEMTTDCKSMSNDCKSVMSDCESLSTY
jgi:hypothetical protein